MVKIFPILLMTLMLTSCWLPEKSREYSEIEEVSQATKEELSKPTQIDCGSDMVDGKYDCAVVTGDLAKLFLLCDVDQEGNVDNCEQNPAKENIDLVPAN